MEIKQILLQPYEPSQVSAIWIKPMDDTIELKVFNNGKWRSTTPSPNSVLVVSVLKNLATWQIFM